MRKLNYILCLLIAFAGTAFRYAEPAFSDLPDRQYIRNVPFTPQLPNFCGPASLSSLFSYWGMQVSQKTIADKTYNNRTKGTNGADLLLYARETGMSAYSFNGTVSGLKDKVSKGYPVIVLQDMSRTSKDGHFRIVTGYNDRNGTMTLRDNTKSSLIIMPYADFDHLWKRRGRWAMVMTPCDKDIFADTYGKNNTVLHMDLAQAYLRRGDMDRCREECIEAARLEPANPHVKKLMTQSGIKQDKGT